MSRILILNGSYRRHAFTVSLIRSFQKGAEEAGHEVEVVNLCDKKIHPCIGCLQGGRDTLSPCTQKDDMDDIYGAYRKADLIVFATPLFFWAMSGLLKNCLDRLWALAEGEEDQLHGNEKSGLLLVAAGGSHPQSILDHFGYLMTRLQWKNRGHYVLMHTDDKNIHEIPLWEELVELGKNI